MKRLWIIPVLVLCGVTPAFAGASSENRLDNKALEGPEGKGAHSTDPNVERSGSPGPTGPSDQGAAPSNKPAGQQFNDYGTGSSGPGAGTSGTGTSGSGASGAGATDSGSSTSGSSSGTSGSGTSGSSGMKSPGSDKMQPRQTP